jgi:DNA-binding NarL/FixJ family response regulator
LISVVTEPGQFEVIVRVLKSPDLEFEHYESATELLDGAAHPSAIVVSLVSVGLEAPAIVEPLVRHFGSIPLVTICSDIERRQIRAALAAGVAGVVLSDELNLALPACLQAVLAGQLCVPRKHARQVEPPPLSTREKQILGLVVMGFTNGQIAEQLVVAESTVKSHLSSAFGKLGVRSRNEAVKFILDPVRGLGVGILTLGAEPFDADTSAS